MHNVMTRLRTFRRLTRNYLLGVIGTTLAIWTSASLADGLELNLVSPSSINDRLRAGAVSQKARQIAIDQLFQQVGCQTDKQQVDKRWANVICTLPGETTATIIVGGHFDFVDKGQGIVDDWSGASLLPSLYQTLKDTRRKHTY